VDIIKLNATASTNDFLKDICCTQRLENFTVVMAENQTRGKGQRGNVWNVEPNKNLTFSVLYKNYSGLENSVFDLNIAVCVSIIETLEKIKIPKLYIKWPNDILSDGKKIAGILIENTISWQQSVLSVIGIGINVNQTDFTGFPQASSLKNCTQKEFDKDEIMHEIVACLQKNTSFISDGNTQIIWHKYHNFLFKKDALSVFELPNNTKFMGIIQQVLKNGKLQIMLEDNSIKEFGLKEVRMIY